MYKLIYYIKDFFSQPKISHQTNLYPEQDARELYSMCGDFIVLRARNGHTYWYCFLKDKKYLNRVRDILARNGVRGRLHFSHYYQMCPVIRVPQREAQQNSFIKYIDMYATAMENHKQKAAGNIKQNTK